MCDADEKGKQIPGEYFWQKREDTLHSHSCSSVVESSVWEKWSKIFNACIINTLMPNLSWQTFSWFETFLLYSDSLTVVSLKKVRDFPHVPPATFRVSGKKLSGVEWSGVMEWNLCNKSENFKIKSILKMQNLFRVSYMGVKDCQNNWIP